MSWNDFIETQLIGTKAVTKAMIIGKEDGTVWASSHPDFVPKAYMTKYVFDDGNEADVQINEAAGLSQVGRTLDVPVTGLRIDGHKYTPIRKFPEGSAADGLTTVYFTRPGASGCLSATKSAVIIGVYEGSDPSAKQFCNTAVENLGRYLKENGF